MVTGRGTFNLARPEMGGEIRWMAIAVEAALLQPDMPGFLFVGRFEVNDATDRRSCGIPFGNRYGVRDFTGQDFGAGAGTGPRFRINVGILGIIRIGVVWIAIATAVEVEADSVFVAGLEF